MFQSINFCFTLMCLGLHGLHNGHVPVFNRKVCSKPVSPVSMDWEGSQPTWPPSLTRAPAATNCLLTVVLRTWSKSKLCQTLGWIPTVVKFPARSNMRHLSGSSNITSDWVPPLAFDHKTRLPLRSWKWVGLKVGSLFWVLRGALHSPPAAHLPWNSAAAPTHPDACPKGASLSPSHPCLPSSSTKPALPEALMPGLSWLCRGTIGSSHRCATFSSLGL